jgi:hypothetical protein
MTLSKKQLTILFLAGISFILGVVILKSIDFLVKTKYVDESFQQMTGENNNTSSTDNSSSNSSSSCTKCFDKFINQMNQGSNSKISHTVSLPLNTTISCKNSCSPTGRCAITGQQCLADIDCPGCQPNESTSSESSDCVPGYDGAGKLTGGITPTYSALTTDIGTQATTFVRNKFSKPPSPNYGVNIWMSTFKEENDMFKQRYTPSGLQYMPSYPERYSVTGDFVENGPLPSNSFLK